jgi:hypothetical protein
LNQSRRKIAHSLHNLGDDDEQRHALSRSRSSNDASTREDDSPEATELRRRARAELYDKARALEALKRRLQRDGRGAGTARRAASFDDFVDEEGRLHEKTPVATTSATAMEHGDGLRKRNAVAAGAALGAAAANPFADEMGMDLSEKSEVPQASRASIVEFPPTRESRESTATLQEDNAGMVVDTDVASPTAGSDLLLDLTPTTSTVPSSFPFTAADTPRSPSPIQENENQTVRTDFRSVHEWAEASSASFYSAPESEPSTSADDHTSYSGSQTPSIVDDADERLSHAEVMSEIGGISTPESWTEVGSMISDEDA